MPIPQITVFLEDRPRALHDLLDLLAAGGINIRALSMAEPRDYGAMRLIVSDHAQAMRVMTEARLPVREVPVLAAEVPDRPGGLAQIVRLLAERGIDIHYCYAFFTRHEDRAWVILRVQDPAFAASVLARNGVRTLEPADLESFGDG